MQKMTCLSMMKMKKIAVLNMLLIILQTVLAVCVCMLSICMHFQGEKKKRKTMLEAYDILWEFFNSLNTCIV